MIDADADNLFPVRSARQLCALILVALLLQACPPEEETNTGGSGVGGASGMGGVGGVSGMGGVGGVSGMGGVGGAEAPERTACGYGARCTLGAGGAFEWCERNVCGDGNTVSGLCFEDDNYLCDCLSDICSLDDCIETSPCEPGRTGNELCAREAADFCGGEEQVRVAVCNAFIGGTRCDIICKTGGAITCQ